VIILVSSLVSSGYVLAQEPHPRLSSLPDNSAIDLGPYTCSSPEDDPSGCQTITDYSGFVYDRLNHQFLMFGGGHSATHRTDVDSFSFKSLSWTSAYPSTLCRDMRLANRGLVRGDWLPTGHPIARHTYDMLVMAENIQRLIVLGDVSGQGGCVEKSPPDKELYFLVGKVAMYDPVGRTWSYSAASNDGWQDFASAEYDPVSGLIIVVDRYSLWTYDPITQVKVKRLSYTSGPMGYAKNLVYFPPSRKMYYIADGSVIFEVDVANASGARLSLRQVTDITGDIPTLAETGFAYDAVNQIIGGGVSKGIFYAYDPVRKAWVSRVIKPVQSGPSVGTVAFHALGYDPANNVFVFITDQESGRRTWAYRYGGAQRAPGVPTTPSQLSPSK
jgi:hypothetical protein